MTLVFTDGRTANGDIFLDPVSRFRQGPQEPVEFFNQGDPYFVLDMRERGGDTPWMVVAKGSVARAMTPLPPPESDDALIEAKVGVSVEVTLAGGERCRGFFFPEVQEGRGRLVDYLNSYRHRFLVLSDTEQLMLVNRDAVTSVRELP